MKTTAQKWGNSLAIRVPKSVAIQVGLKAQDDLDIEVQDGNVVLKPHLQRVYRLEDSSNRLPQRTCMARLIRASRSAARSGDEEAQLRSRPRGYRVVAIQPTIRV